jgi:ubiquinone/menaquinone biosynthesis C-methylase UbiE
VLEDKGYWEDIGDQYQQYAGAIPLAGRLTRRCVRYTQRAALGEFRSLLNGKRVLEVGCGTGYWFDDFNKWGARSIYGIDISRAMLKTSGSNGVAEASATDLPFANGSFDVVLAISVLEHLTETEDVRQAIGEIVRVLNNNGYAICLELSWPYAVSLFAPQLSIPKGEWETMFRESGFDVVNVRPVNPSFIKYAFGLLTHRLAKLLIKGKTKREIQAGQSLSSSSAILRLYHLVNDLISVPPLILLKVAKVLWPRLSSHWIFIVKKTEAANTQ